MLEVLTIVDYGVVGGLLALFIFCACMLWRHRAGRRLQSVQFVRMPPEEDSVLQKMQVIYDDSTYAPYMSPTLSAKEKLQRALEMGEGEGDDENEDDGNEDDDTPTDDTLDFSNIFHINETTDSSATA